MSKTLNAESRASIANVILNRPRPLHTLDYRIPAELSNTLTAGMRVIIPFQKKTAVGIVHGISSETTLPHGRLKSILDCIDTEPIFSETLFALCDWASQYYHHALGEVFFQALPIPLRTGKPLAPRSTKSTSREVTDQPFFTSPDFTLNPDQKTAVHAITQSLGSFQPFLLDGATGSGKTEVYFQVMAEVIRQGRQALLLVPEISLTPQTIQRVQARFHFPIACLHSGMTPAKRLEAWLQARNGEVPIVIGTRSALFTAFPALGVIILDEEHDMSFKQPEGFKYSARDLAIMRAHLEQLPVVLGSATPSLETLQNAQAGRYRTLRLPQRTGGACQTRYHVVDLRQEPPKHGLSSTALHTIQDHLERGQQVLLFLNRRGYAPTLMCPRCAWIAQCARCTANLTLHRAQAQLRCHHCEAVKPIPSHCPTCAAPKLQSIGAGTERLEYRLRDVLPDTPIVRIDRDTTRAKGALPDLLEHVRSGEPQVLLGTQMIAKGHHFPAVTLVVIVDFDAGFFSADFRTTERVAQLLIQVAGRTGRAEAGGDVLVQTYHPEHPLLHTLLQAGYAAFAEQALQARKRMKLPPFSHFALFRAEALRETAAHTFLTDLKEMGRQFSPSSPIKLLGPVPAPLARRRGHHRAQLLVQSTSRHALQECLTTLCKRISELKAAKRVRWSLDVDPLEMY